MSPVLLPDPLAVAVAWAKADGDITAIVGQRISTDLPPDPKLPWLRCQTIDGGIDSSGIPIGLFIIQWDAFDAGESAVGVTPDYPGASLLARTLHAKAVISGEGGTFAFPALNAVVYSNLPISGPIKVPDEPTGWARIRVDTEIMFRAA